MYLDEIRKLNYHDYDALKYYLIEGVNRSTGQSFKKVDADVTPKDLITGLLRSEGYMTSQTFQGMKVYNGVTKYKNEAELNQSDSEIVFKATLLDKRTGNPKNSVTFYGYK